MILRKLGFLKLTQSKFIDRQYLRQFRGLSDLLLDLLDFFDELTLVTAA